MFCLVPPQISIALSSDWYEPSDYAVDEHVEASIRATSFHLGWFAEPIFLTGDYPELMKAQVAIQSREETRLEALTEAEKALIKGDFLKRLLLFVCARVLHPGFLN